MSTDLMAEKMSKFDDSTDLALFVRTSEEDIVGWDRAKIVAALVRETGIDQNVAEMIGKEVEVQIKSLNLKNVTSPLIRELVDVKLLEYGLEDARRKHTRLGSPLYDVKNIIFNPNKENANVPHGPEATNLTLAENIKKEFALLSVFSSDIADAHMRGDLHLHDLGFIDRPYCSGQSVEYVKKFGLDLPNALSIAKPARHAEVLLAQMVKFSAALQGVFAGAIGWDAVNIFFAPFLVGMSDAEVRQIAQMMIYEYSQQAVARGGQAIFSDINLYWEVPKHFEKVPAMGPGGQYTGKTYGDYIKDSQRFVWAMFDVYKEGDGSGRPFFFPKPLVHMTEKFFETEGHEKFLRHISEVATEMGNTYFVFDRGETAKISECCRLSFKLEQSDLDDAKEPWRMRYSALQNVTVNLPRLAFKAEGSDAKLFELIDQHLELAAKAHLQKKTFISEILAAGQRGPLSLLAMNRDGQQYLRMFRVSYLMGILGLNEVVQAHKGQELHESPEALKFGLRVISHMKLTCEVLSKKYDMHFVLEQTPAESTAYRFAKLDREHFPEAADRVVKGNKGTNEIYYTNSTYFNVSNSMSSIDRVKQEGLFHPLIDAGALTHVWLGESKPSPDSIANFVTKTFRHTQNAQIAFSPEFTSCNQCGKITRGLRDQCPYCRSENIEGITRITGYFSRISGWNKGKLAELKERYRNGNVNS
ncbi:anaerobic ribonucleoside-triphosphate reductase [candidate division WOR-1 bacterium RIFOXYA12_FULL_52_29]|uniref:Anaerobic ribonucleoside-triphosphate reductase n=1 Tax=candidate division WOR-1 bacterium RIFOXYC12_FULL_54_18 TaxID=1802584 RepID=A0A1F4T703_UNCSA|nr:MAG: anaerobic ribonucleoside-triphosphate reductase [candidate division WOR-1 bacterium RIFOXYA2_FULL_51_19]OGC17882.1 MAG: anaerobic ribonucleoside-triphosphate reductase [candidate division WOR-1 bacterium RIFOXYA12_FULL_52_29]OGC26738.1 MAG: anaerobic ribonucleoside-triphosphate reductase [candidate division WOR-1 bacterium RIFOXYB2_FULL_45_9]OGC28299.1 MAG: anaerobic ribonucleoside-triphosphate reductase [candidate division WOR-1 bacterium RIFOXYC12_FULL_54_18]OGC31321.1 MAG: anaerobic 